jgi:hypothetical protein
MSASHAVAAQFDGPCGGGTYTTHSNGLGQTFQDCAALHTYNQTQAIEAANAWLKAMGGGTWSNSSCGFAKPTDLILVATTSNPVQSAVWTYAGTDAGSALVGTTCPSAGMNAWD